jgi:ankyrin repeat protein/cytochrome c551/c552
MYVGRVLGVVAVSVLGGIVAAQEPAKVDFARDIQPLFQDQCVGCHGPTQQMNGLRLDRRHDALRGATMGIVIKPGNSAGSKLYRMIAHEQGPQMPPGESLTAAQIEAVKTWIDQGAVWPDALSGETTMADADPNATRLLQALRANDVRAQRRMLQEHPEAAKRRGAGGITPLMYAALYGDLDTMRRVLDKGADVNAKNDAGATALMWAVHDVEKTRLLLECGADATARSFDGRTPLLIAAGRFGSGPILKLLLDRGASLGAKSRGLFGETTALTEAVYAGDGAAVELLLKQGLRPGAIEIALANQSRCEPCLQQLLPYANRVMLDAALPLMMPPFADATRIARLFALGADPNGTDRAGRSVLTLAAASAAAPVDVVQRLIEDGADAHAVAPGGETPLALAARHGRTPLVEFLETTGATRPAPSHGTTTPSRAGSPRDAVERSLPLLFKTGETFLDKSGCVSCHNNTLLMMTVAAARAGGVTVDETAARAQTRRIGAFIETWRERILQGVGIPGDADTISYILHGLAADRYAPDAATDAMARYVKNRQMADGRWAILAHRPPIESTDVQVTATAIRALRVYAPAGQRAEYEAAARRGATWLAVASSHTTGDHAFRLLGLHWADAQPSVIRSAADDLLATQRPDGSWAQLPTLAGDAYATGLALVALYESGALATGAPAYRRGVEFLLGTQHADGSWFVRTRAIPLQPLFDIGFPHGNDSWISAAAINWAATALAYAAQPAPTRRRTSRAGE